MAVQNNKYLFVFLLILVLLSLGIIYLLLSNIKPTKEETTLIPTPTIYSIRRATPSSSSYSFSSFQKTVIGKTTDKEIESLTNIISKQASDGGTITYLVKSVNPLQPDKILTKNGTTIYEETSTFTSNAGGFPKISFYKDIFGQPEEEIVGSEKYGHLATAYIYASKGFSLIGNSNTDEVYEIKRFLPLSLDQYKKLYGSDINTSVFKE